MIWHSNTIEEIFKVIISSREGLQSDEAAKRLAHFGKNELLTKKKKSPVLLFLNQFNDIMIIVLIAAAIISAFIGEITDTIVIIVIIFVNAIIGFVQEYRAEKAMDALKKMAAQKADVLRDGIVHETDAAELVPGDIVLLEAGNNVPADLRLIEVNALKINESSLTGESNSVDKKEGRLMEDDIPLGDRINMAYKGTAVTNGTAKAVVVSTGMQTELGKIAVMLETADSETPLQKRLKELSKKLTFIILILCVVFFVTGYLRGENLENILLTAISLAVAAIPEALPAVITVSLAIGAKKLMQKNVLIRKLQAVETLGSVTFICTDKTGTLTKNKMAVKEIWAKNEAMKQKLLMAMTLNHDVKEKDGKFAGDPTELAMLEYAQKNSHFSNGDAKLTYSIPFDSDRKAMSTIHQYENEEWLITKGATESIESMLANDNDKDSIEKETERMSAEGIRVIAFAGRKILDKSKNTTPEEIETSLTFIGLVGLIDPPRPEAKKAIEHCKTAGIVPVMITGDHPLTAAAIAKEIGIIDQSWQKVITGVQLAALTDDAYKEDIENIRVYARVTPEQKLKIVDTLQQKGHFVSMTGDGVNDAPSLKKANIGVAMGITGTDVSKEASHMILLDDNFASIIGAVKEGRRIYDNLRKFVKYIFTGNSAEILTLFVAPLIGLPIPLLPVHILWVNLITDGLPALALSTEPAEKNIMKRPPRSPRESIFAQGLGIHIIWVGAFIAAITIATQFYAIHHKIAHWQTLVFTILCFAQLWHVLAIKSENSSIFKMGLLNNKPLLWAVLGTTALQLAVVYIPVLNNYFHTQPLTAAELMAAIAISSIVLVVVEIEKLVKRKKKSNA